MTKLGSIYKANKFLLIIKDFARLDLSSEAVDALRMRYIVAYVLRGYTENVNAVNHYTPHEVFRCLVNVLLAGGSEDTYEPRNFIKVGDYVFGGGITACAI